MKLKIKEKMENGEIFNPEEIVKYILYLDANNLHGNAMCYRLPIGGHKWISEDEKEHYMKNPSSIEPCTLEVDLDYIEIRDYTNYIVTTHLRLKA